MMTREEFLHHVAALVAGLQVPVSLPGGRRLLGAGFAHWEALQTEVQPFGWISEEQAEEHFKQLLAYTGEG
jgi:hypothetical protein